MITKAMIESACKADLIIYMETHHPERIVFKESCYRDTEHDSLVLYPDHYHRFSNSEHGNSITYLRMYLGMSFQKAVAELPSTDSTCKSKSKTGRKFYKPICAKSSVDVVIDYLLGRGISKETLDKLLTQQKLYATIIHDDVYACFANNVDNFFILRDTIGSNKLIINESHGGYWSFSTDDFVKHDLMGYMQKLYGDNTDTIYVCESAIDAISLYEITKQDGIYDGIYCAMAGLKSIAMEQIKRRYPDNEIVLAVDNDKAGDTFCDRYPDLKRIVPCGKDWNDDLKNKSAG